MTSRTHLSRAAAFVIAALLAIPGGALAQSRPAEDTLARRSQEATSAREHASVAREYRERAEAFEKTASDYEAQAAKLAARPRFPSEGKMVEHIRNRGDRERRMAMQSRRSAQEAYARADHHVRMAVETQLAE